MSKSACGNSLSVAKSNAPRALSTVNLRPVTLARSREWTWWSRACSRLHRSRPWSHGKLSAILHFSYCVEVIDASRVRVRSERVPGFFSSLSRVRLRLEWDPTSTFVTVLLLNLSGDCFCRFLSMVRYVLVKSPVAKVWTLSLSTQVKRSRRYLYRGRRWYLDGACCLRGWILSCEWVDTSIEFV